MIRVKHLGGLMPYSLVAFVFSPFYLLYRFPFFRLMTRADYEFDYIYH